ncbi:SOS response-associated peptidase family protein [Acinetobacter pittii]|uniref:Abasic site processing protein n=2 Tax=Acinetobacter pittii TaxID=48296 RepID=A0A3R9RED3_ACIPI|nr:MULTISPECIES: SOS response-associated peptidase family protein [Acinetobacter]MDR0067283.1 SOS response-associated peptidase family protein [Acinetobacter sp. 11520]KQE14215.1 ACR protein [Acinetobacter pittii]KQF34828.1 ACR protein [Acinetobacter pittii]KQG07101.1 ACR protein [Acinetobacter pittii]KRI47196.1 ACR protein [Acinetobacter pittii]
MCANYEPISKDRVHLLDLLEPTFEYKNDVYPGYDCPLIFSNNGNIEWRSVKFGLIPKWKHDLKYSHYTYNARTETVSTLHSFRHAWAKSQFALIPVEKIYEPKYVNGKAERWGIYREDRMPFTVAAIYESTIIEGQQVRSMSMLTINATNHPFMNQFHKPEDEKRSIIVIPEEYRIDWLNCKKEEADQFFFEMPVGEYTAEYFPKIK